MRTPPRRRKRFEWYRRGGRDIRQRAARRHCYEGSRGFAAAGSKSSDHYAVASDLVRRLKTNGVVHDSHPEHVLRSLFRINVPVRDHPAASRQKILPSIRSWSVCFLRQCARYGTYAYSSNYCRAATGRRRLRIAAGQRPWLCAGPEAAFERKRPGF